MLDYRIVESKQEIEIDKLLQLYSKAPLGLRKRESLLLALEKCHRYIAIEMNDQYIAAGRSISDGTYTFLLELVVAEPYKRQGFGRRVLDRLLTGEENNYVHLTSTWEAEEFYQKAGFKRHKTGYAKYPRSSEYLVET